VYVGWLGRVGAVVGCGDFGVGWLEGCFCAGCVRSCVSCGGCLWFCVSGSACVFGRVVGEKVGVGGVWVSVSCYVAVMVSGL